ncbi:MAG: 5-oxoprolinase subunit PxpB [Bacillota bacterium]
MTNDANYELLPLGDSAIIIRLGHGIDEATHRKVGALTAYLEEHPFAGMIECVPAFASAAIHYDPVAVMKSCVFSESLHETIYETVCSRLQLILSAVELSGADPDRRTIEIPVCYGGEFGPDLSFVASHNGLSEEEVVAIHTSASYLVYMLGFAPGFPYLGGMSERIAAPRRQSPRTVIPQGSVGIAGGQTGVYPVATPGGWQLIGRTPLELFRPREAVPSLLRSGDSVRFKPITKEQYNLYLEGAL